MVWETRAGSSGRYYYRARKVNGRVVKEYVGTGDLADALAGLDALDRQSAALRAEEQHQEWERRAALDTTVDKFSRVVDGIVVAALEQAGYHQHARGAWRRKRDKQSMRFDFAKLAEWDRVAEGGTRALDSAPGAAVAIAATITTPAEEPMPTTADAAPAAAKPVKPAKPVPVARVPSAQLSPHDKAQRLEILTRAQNGDKAVLPQLHELLQDAPKGGLLPVAQTTEEALLKAMYAENLLAYEDTRQQMAVLRGDLAGANPSPLETLLVERVALCWLTLHQHETIYAQIMGKLPGDVHARFQDRIDRAHKRYLSAIKTLAQVRRLQVPLSVQVNVAAQGGQQVNVSGVAPAG